MADIKVLGTLTVDAPTATGHAANKSYADDTFISLATLQTEVAASTDFADFQSRIAAL